MFVRILVTLVVLFGLFTFNGCKKEPPAPTTPPTTPAGPNTPGT